MADSQSGYTAISLNALETLDLDKIYKRYGMPKDFLVRLNVYGFRVTDVPITPVYNIGERSGIRLWRVVPKLSFLLLKLFLWRLKEKYIIRDFHPLVFFYGLAFSLLAISLPLFVRLVCFLLATGNIPKINALALLLAPFLPAPLPAVVALMARLWWTVAELVSVAIAVLVGKRF